MNRRLLQRIGLATMAILVFLIATPEYRARAEAAWQIIFNGTVSHSQVIQTDSGPMIPVYLPVPDPKEPATYGIHIETDVASHQIKVVKVKKKGPTTARSGECPKCNGTKKCQDCYPPGSGVNTSGGECYSCNGTGDCPYCKGSGKCYMCGGDGEPGGCWTCGKDSG